MKKTFSIAMLAMTCIGLVSCQKEVDDSGTTSANTSPKLVRAVAKTGSDSLVATYSYDQSNKLTMLTTAGTQSGQAVDASLKWVRNASGIILKQITKSSSFAAFGLDSILTVVNYNTTSSLYTSSVSHISFMGFEFADSISYQYTGGKLSSQLEYVDDGSGSGYAPASKTEYTYAGSNLGSFKIYSYDDASSSYTLDETHTLEYDSKINPLQFATEAPVLGMSTFYSANNITKSTLVATDPSNNETITATYTYNSSNFPVTSTSVNGSTTTIMNMYYQ